jgi:hypothetical protein
MYSYLMRYYTSGVLGPWSRKPSGKSSCKSTGFNSDTRDRRCYFQYVSESVVTGPKVCRFGKLSFPFARGKEFADLVIARNIIYPFGMPRCLQRSLLFSLNSSFMCCGRLLFTTGAADKVRQLEVNRLRPSKHCDDGDV